MVPQNGLMTVLTVFTLYALTNGETYCTDSDQQISVCEEGVCCGDLYCCGKNAVCNDGGQCVRAEIDSIQSSRGLGGGIIAAIVIVSVVAFLTASAFLYYWLRVRQKKTGVVLPSHSSEQDKTPFPTDKNDGNGVRQINNTETHRMVNGTVFNYGDRSSIVDRDDTARHLTRGLETDVRFLQPKDTERLKNPLNIENAAKNLAEVDEQMSRIVEEQLRKQQAGGETQKRASNAKVDKDQSAPKKAEPQRTDEVLIRSPDKSDKHALVSRSDRDSSSSSNSVSAGKKSDAVNKQAAQDKKNEQDEEEEEEDEEEVEVEVDDDDDDDNDGDDGDDGEGGEDDDDDDQGDKRQQKGNKNEVSFSQSKPAARNPKSSSSKSSSSGEDA